MRKDINFHKPRFVKLKTGTDKYELTPLKKIKINDIIVIKRGDSVPADGIIYSTTPVLLKVNSTSYSNASATYSNGSMVYAGMINLMQEFTLKVTQLPRKSLLHLKQNQLKKMWIWNQKRFAKIRRIFRYGIYTQLILVGLIFTFWFIYALVMTFTLTNASKTTIFLYYFFDYAIDNSVAILIILSSTIIIFLPTLLMTCVYKSYKKQIWINRLNILMEMNSLNAIAFDKNSIFYPTGRKISNLSYKDNNVLYLSILQAIQLKTNFTILRNLSSSLNNFPIADIINPETIDTNVVQTFYNGKNILLAPRKYILKNYPNSQNLNHYPQQYLMRYGNEIVTGFNATNSYSKSVYRLLDFLKRNNYDIIFFVDDEFLPTTDDLWKVVPPSCIYYNTKQESKIEIMNSIQKQKKKKILYVGNGTDDIDVIKNFKYSLIFADEKTCLNSQSSLGILNNNIDSIIFLIKLNRWINILKVTGIFWYICYTTLVIILAALGLITAVISAVILLAACLVFFGFLLVIKGLVCK